MAIISQCQMSVALPRAAGVRLEGRVPENRRASGLNFVFHYINTEQAILFKSLGTATIGFAILSLPWVAYAEQHHDKCITFLIIRAVTVTSTMVLKNMYIHHADVHRRTITFIRHMYVRVFYVCTYICFSHMYIHI